MEQEKIELARKGIEEDKERFQKIMDDSDKNYKRVREDVQKAGVLKTKLMKQIAELEFKIGSKDTMIKKVEDEFIQDKTNKHFLDILAIQAGLKQPMNQACTSHSCSHKKVGLTF